MKDDFVQVNVRMTRNQRKQLKDIAEKEETSMNQFIIGKTFDRMSDSTDDAVDRVNDRAIIEELQQQLKQMDEQPDVIDDRELIEVLMEQLNQNKSQVDIKDEQIEKLHNMLDQQQQLSLKSSQQIEYLQLEIESTEEEFSEESDEEKKQGFWSRLFNL